MSDSESRKQKHPTDDDCKVSFLFRIEARRFVSRSSKSWPIVTYGGLKIENVTLKQVQHRRSCKSSKHLNKLVKNTRLSLGVYGKTIDKELIRKFAKLASGSRIDACTAVNVVVESNIVEELKSLTLDEAEDDICAICLDTGDESNINLPCLHHFHRTCLLEWLRKKQECPLCRRPLPKI